jgi:hypothetical protein
VHTDPANPGTPAAPTAQPSAEIRTIASNVVYADDARITDDSTLAAYALLLLHELES